MRPGWEGAAGRGPASQVDPGEVLGKGPGRQEGLGPGGSSPDARPSGSSVLDLRAWGRPSGLPWLPTALNPAHNGRVCSTWGDFHYKTFDGDVFRFPGLCNYVLSAHCGAAYEDFNIQVRRGLESNVTTLARVTMKLDGMVIELTKSSIQVNGLP